MGLRQGSPKSGPADLVPETPPADRVEQIQILLTEDSPSTLPLSSCSYGSHNGAPTMDTPPTPETGAAAESPPPRHAGGDSTSFKKAMDSVYVQAATFQVRPEFGGHVHLGSIMRAFMGQWTRHPEALKGKFPQRHPEPQITRRTEGQVWRRLQLAQLCTRHPWWR